MKKIEDIINKVHCADCFEFMKTMPENLVDTIISDVPYGLKFMGKRWDYDVPSVKIFKEMLRVAKPGATALIFAGARTYHRLACAVEDAGWQIFDCIFYCYGSGFPKSHNISKAMAKRQGAKKQGAGSKGNTFPLNKEYQDYELTPEAKLWNGWGTALKPAVEPIVCARKPLEGTYAENALKWGVAGLNIDGGRIPLQDKEDTKRVKSGHKTSYIGGEMKKNFNIENQADRDRGRFPANLILDEEAGKILDSQQQGASRFFYCAKSSQEEKNRGLERFEGKDRKEEWGDKFGAVDRRLKTGSNSVGKFKNIHPTVKPLKLMEYLCLLTKTPKGGIILDPFAGSGTTGMAAKKVGRDYILIEKEEDYCKIAEARIKAQPRLLL